MSNEKNEGLLLKVTVEENTIDEPGSLHVHCGVCGDGHAEFHVECFSCDRSQIGTEFELKRKGWFLARFELCPGHARDPYEWSKALERFEREMLKAYPQLEGVPA